MLTDDDNNNNIILLNDYYYRQMCCSRQSGILHTLTLHLLVSTNGGNKFGLQMYTSAVRG